MTYDVVVCGAGVAGLTAAVRCAQAGAKVLVLAKGIGATHLAPGTIDVLGYAGDARVDRPGEALEAFTAAHPDHPYARVTGAEVGEALAWLTQVFEAGSLAPYGYVGSLEQNMLLATPAGAVKPTALAPSTLAAGDLRGGGRVCLVSVRVLRDFFGGLAAGALVRADGLGGELAARHILLDLPVDGRADTNALGLAEALEDPVFRGRLVGALAPRLEGDERVGLPAALGLNDPHHVWSELQDKLGRPVFEIPTLPPSVPGIRLFRTLREALRRAGGRIIVGAEVLGARVEGDRVSAVRARVSAREQVHPCGWVVLATGGFGSGGLELDSSWKGTETVLGLPVAGVPAAGAPRFGPEYFGEHPMSRAGVATDAELRPLGRDGERVYENVLVAGATLAGAEPWKEKSGDGISLATGFKAAGLVLEGVGAVQTGAA
jgi:glycerol-3-phosphate dehydrogenase subunit B